MRRWGRRPAPWPDKPASGLRATVSSVKRGLPLAAGCAILAGFAVVSGLAQAAGGSTTTFNVPGVVTAIGADGPRVAIAVRSSSGCDHAVVWTAPGPASQTYTAEFSCAGSAAHGITEIAIAGNRVEWVATASGNTQDMALEAATAGRPKVSTVAFGSNAAGAAGLVDGDWIGRLYGDGTLLVFDTWHECALSRPEGSAPCGQGLLAGGTVYTKQTLWKLVGLTKAKIRSGADAFEAVAVDGGRVALQGIRDGSVIVVDSHGRQLTTGAITGATSSGTAMQGTQVVTLRGTSMQVWDASTGHLNGVVPLPAGKGAAVIRDLQNGVVVYLQGRAVRVARLADSRQTAFVVPGRRAVDAQIEAPGLFYAYNATSGSSRGRVVFVPWATLVAKLH